LGSKVFGVWHQVNGRVVETWGIWFTLSRPICWFRLCYSEMWTYQGGWLKVVVQTAGAHQSIYVIEDKITWHNPLCIGSSFHVHTSITIHPVHIIYPKGFLHRLIRIVGMQDV
jgi:hypothetical protein